jgi:hypothetical protein
MNSQNAIRFQVDWGVFVSEVDRVCDQDPS